MFGKSSENADRNIPLDRLSGIARNGPGACIEQLEDRRLLSGSVVAHWPSHLTPARRATATAAVDVAPVLASVPNATVNYGQTFTYQVSASGSPAPTYSLDIAPAGMVIDPNTGLITWTPNLSDVGVKTVAVLATNSVNEDSAEFNITVTNLNPPVITPPPNMSVSLGATLSYQLAATGGPAPTFSLVSGPVGLTITPSGLIAWTPTALAAAQSVTASASNVVGSDTSTFSVSVVPDKTPPTIPLLAIGSITTINSIPLSWSSATDDVGVAGYRVFNYTPAVYRGHSGRGGGYYLVSPAKYTLLVNGITSTRYTLTGLAPNSTHQYAVTAFDAAGNQSGYSNVVVGTTLNPPAFTWSYYGVTNAALTDVADHTLNVYFSVTGSPAPTLTMLSAPAGVTFNPGQWTNSQLTTVIPNFSWTPTPSQTFTSFITMQAINSVGTYTYSIPVNVTPDTPQISLSLNGGIAYGAAQFAAGQAHYMATANPGFGGAAHPQYGLAGVPLNFQVTDASNAGPTTFEAWGASGLSIDPNTGAGIWTPTQYYAGNTTITVQASNSAGSSRFDFTFPTYFTGAPGTPSATYYTSTSGVRSPNPTINWTAPTDTNGITGYTIKVTDAHTNVTTTFDTKSTATSYALSGLGNQQYFVSVTPYDQRQNPGMTSSVISIYGAALPALSWTPTAPNPVVGSTTSIQFAPNNGAYTYSIASGPVGATIDAKTGLLIWTPTNPGNFTIIVVASSNGWGAIDPVLNLSVIAGATPASLALSSPW